MTSDPCLDSGRPAGIQQGPAIGDGCDTVASVRMAAPSFVATDWSAVPETKHAGETGHASWRTLQFGDVRVRRVSYSPGYLADHWCVKGHVLFCIAGELTTELADGRIAVLQPGMSYQVADDAEPHRSSTAVGAELFIVD